MLEAAKGRQNGTNGIDILHDLPGGGHGGADVLPVVGAAQLKLADLTNHLPIYTDSAIVNKGSRRSKVRDFLPRTMSGNQFREVVFGKINSLVLGCLMGEQI